MQFDWEGAISRNFEAIERIVASLYALAGITSLDPVVATLPRHLYLRILSVLRPAEYAARRLIAMAACRLSVSSPPQRPAPEPGPARARKKPAGSARERIPAFPLFDPFKPFEDPWLTPAEIAALDNPVRFVPVVPDLPPREPVDARALCRRIAALRNALADFDGQAARLARWRARRAAGNARPRRWSPLRPGRPPGWKRRPKSEVGEVLKECHFLARDIWETPDTS